MNPYIPFLKVSDQLIEIYADSYCVDIIRPEQSVIKIPNVKQGTVNIGAYCYLDRVGSGVTNRALKVNPTSFCQQRAKLISKIITLCSEGRFSGTELKTLGPVFNFIDEHKLSNSISESIEEAKNIYAQYTIYLQQRMNTSNVGSKSEIKSPMASRCQRVMAKIISCIYDIEATTVQRWTKLIKQRKSGRNLPSVRISDREMSAAFAVYELIFEAICDFLQNQKALPLIIPFSEIGLNDFILYNPKRHSMNRFGLDTKSLVASAAFMFDEKGLKPIAELLLRRKDIKWGEKQLIQAYDSVTKLSQQTESMIINEATDAFCHIILATTGMNPDLLASIDMSEPRLHPGINTRRLIGIKNKIGGAIQGYSFEARYIKHWRRYQFLKQRMEEISGETFNKGIHYLSLKEKPKQLVSVSRRDLSSRHLRLPLEIKNVLPKEWRAFAEQSFLEDTHGDIELSAKLLKHTPETARKHYAFKNLETSATEMNKFFNAMKEWSNLTINNPETAARINKEAYRTPVGSCDSQEAKPELIEGFDLRSPEPNCGAPATCFFCKYYALHADEEDITNLLSAREWLTIQTDIVSESIDEHISKFLPSIERIDVIINKFEQRSDECKNIVAKAKQRIINGNLIRYWGLKIDALIDGGII